MPAPYHRPPNKPDWTFLFKSQQSPEGFQKVMKILSRIFAGFVILILFLFLSPSPFYMLDSSDEAVVTRFGKLIRTETQAGLKFKIPFLEQVQTVNVTGVRRMEFGYRDKGNNETGMFRGSEIANVAPTSQSDIDSESRMLTSDMNLVIADWAIQYRVSNSADFLFNVDDPEGTLRIISESTYRRVVAAHPLDDILTNKKDIIQAEIMIDLQELCKKYGMGVTITSVQLQDALPPDRVKAAFLDVTSAIEEKSSKENEANKYANEKMPVARGDAQKQLNDAEGYKQSRIAEAVGAVARYKSIAAEYAKMPQITRTRMYLETISKVLPAVTAVYIVDGGGDTLKFLPLNRIAGPAENKQ